MELYLDSNSSGDVISKESLPHSNLQKPTNVTLSPDSIEYDSNSAGDLDSLPNDINGQLDQNCLYVGMPVLEDGLSSGHASDTDFTNANALNCVLHQDSSKTDDVDERKKTDEFDDDGEEQISVESTLRDIHSTLQRTKILLEISNQRNNTKNDNSNNSTPTVWVRR